MSFNVPASFQVTYKNSVEMALQQNRSVIEQGVLMGGETGEKVKVKDIVGQTEAQEADERHGNTRWNNRTYDGVWLPKPNELYDAGIVDRADQLATAIQLGSTETMGQAQTIARGKDRRLLEGFYGDVISGKTGTTVTPFPSGSIIPVTTGGASGAQPMNTKKLREANVFIRESYVDTGAKKFMVLTAEDNDALLDEVPATSEDFKRAFGAVIDENGNLQRMLGWNFLHMELDNPLLTTIPDLATDSSGYRKTPFWVWGGFVGNYWEKLRTEVGKIPEKLFQPGYLMGTTLGSTRTQVGMAGIILNNKG